MLYVREDIPSNLLATEEKIHVEGLHVELNLRNKKWLINCFQNPNKTITSSHFDVLSKDLDLHSSTYEKVLLLGDYNVRIDEQYMKSFRENYKTNLNVTKMQLVLHVLI